ncbi:hypothetical protein [Bythopirellula goksoeyrii]|uniref:Uncharacterized protein n=1 Tax=Bythopirellula goksoeyrii TaxID=1400387 RepID=A0A5B9QQU6_9BACT|nr:hypothetical protein [Bythopirellula goksoeyrii]QEG36343.1 hypothetical protein Pr1d_36560 [Bythopirellula goksoeyrii]
MTANKLIAFFAFAFSLTGVSDAQDINLFKTAEAKETAKDFKPAEAKMETNFGNLEATSKSHGSSTTSSC